MRTRQLFAGGIAFVCLLVAFEARQRAFQEPGGFSEVAGRLENCRVAGASVSLSIRTDKGLKQVELAADAVPWPSEAYRKAIGAVYDVAGPCPNKDSGVSIMVCDRCPPAMIAAEVVSEKQGAVQLDRRLWIVQQFEDRLRPGDAPYWHLLGLSSMVARHNQLNGKSKSFWLRDRIARALDTYSSPERAVQMIERYGRPPFASAVPRIVDVYKKYSAEIGLVKAAPYSTPAFVGGWGHFVTEVYVEGKNGGLTRVF